MARFEGNYPDEPKEAPSWFKPFFKNYGLVIKFLNVAGKRGLNLVENLLNVPVSVRVTHAFSVRFQHNLGLTPVLIQPQGGRYLCYTQDSSDKTTSILTFYLISSPVVTTENLNTVDFVDVLDGSLFKLNDQVLVNNQTRQIIRIDTNRLTLDSGIRLTLPAVVVLNSELITVIFL